MIDLGKMNTLQVVKEVDFGMYLDGGNVAGEILLPAKYVPEECKIGDMLPVFIYLDSEERLVATTETPKAMVGDFAYLEVAWVNNFGAFLDWGLLKDLLVPFREQKMKMLKGKKYIVYVHVDDESYRIVATAKIDRYICQEIPPYKEGDAVQILIWQKTDLGFKAIVDNQFQGLLYDNQIFQPLVTGDSLTAYISQVREDGKIDLILQNTGWRHSEEFAETLLRYIRENDGHILFNDKSSADDIYAEFHVSKKTFKKAAGELFKKRLILIGKNDITLVSGE